MEKFQVLLDDELQKVSGGWEDSDDVRICRYGAIGSCIVYTAIGAGCLIASGFAKNRNRKLSLASRGFGALAIGAAVCGGYFAGGVVGANEPERFGVKNN